MSAISEKLNLGDAVTALVSKSYKTTHKTFDGWCVDNGFKRSTVYKQLKRGLSYESSKHLEIIYFIANYDYSTVKVGITKSLKYRMSDLQIANPFPLRFLAAFLGDRNTEKMIHDTLDSMSARIRGEWFDGDLTIRFMTAVRDQGHRFFTDKDLGL